MQDNPQKMKNLNIATKLPLPVFYIPPRPPQRQQAGKDAYPHEQLPVTPPPAPRSARIVPKPGTATVEKAIDPPAKDDGKRRLELELERELENKRRHSAHDALQDVQKAIRKIELVKPPPAVPASVAKTLSDIKSNVKMETKTKKPATTPGPTTRQGRKTRGGALRVYGYEDPLLDGTGRDYRARLVTFYKNGDPFFTGIKTSFRPGRDFSSLEALFNYLTTRMDLPLGVRYIFTVEGVRIRRLDEFESGASYVCSSRRKFEPLNYTVDHKKMWNPHLKFEQPVSEELKLFRAPSPPVKKINGVRERWSPDAPYNGSLPGSREGRVIKVINNLNQKIQVSDLESNKNIPTIKKLSTDHFLRSRILLNLRTAQPWEEVLEDLGQALKLKGAKNLYTVNGQENNVEFMDQISLLYHDVTKRRQIDDCVETCARENHSEVWVKSFSQLRNEFKDVETFYLDTGESHISRTRGDNRKESSRSLDDVYDHRRDKRGKRPGSAPPVPGDRGTYYESKGRRGDRAVQPLNPEYY
uniref:Doublecortin domain-containing protein n=1 Tax=Strigamia maritima TaxID=126957 RepID=T1IJD2_STRMM